MKLNTRTEGNHQKKGKRVSKEQLINKLNYINFQDDTIQINLKHARYNRNISLNAKPQPCTGDHLDCIWTETTRLHQELKTYKFQDVLVANDKNLLLVKPELISISDKGISVLLPEICCEVIPRKAVRHLCEGISVQLIQAGVIFCGSLIDFSIAAFCVEITAGRSQTFQWINPDAPVYIVFSDGDTVLFSGECRILRQTCGQKTRSFVLEPPNDQVQRFKPKEFRSPRQELIPSPDMIFRHPFTKKRISLKVIDLSGSGFSVEDDEDNAVLLPGMIIPQLNLSFADTYEIKGNAQVVYRKNSGEEKENGMAKCGMAVLDMDGKHHVKLVALLQQASNRKSYISGNVDMDALWNFFFDTGFIYPKKYAFIQANKEEIKKTYENLYTTNPNIARHFIYQNRGIILGHMAMLRFYENTWLIHHHAAKTSGSNRAGLAVLNQIGRFINNSHYICSIHMSFVICYFRPDNKFPNYIFGGISKNIDDPKACSIDTFAYFHYQKTSNNASGMSAPWELTETQPEDLVELERFYEQESGGLMIHALDLEAGTIDHDELSKEYEQLGFKRQRDLYSLKKDGSLTAVIIANISDVGLNMSDLTNCIQVIVLDPDELDRDTLNLMFSVLSTKFEQEEIPILLYPVTYADNQSISYEKSYSLWVLNMQYTDHYFSSLKRLLKFV
ncbi:MAG: pilus assembly protein PilZ [Desulfobacterales bacterium C00003060]|nr:MAG: pilus assembly protein PilZ [Desulfobacterales bacterium C00003060]OEU84524.1 MAG: pilus assembly protein PilZ [Desulfobacterales bacterium S5133MH4]